MTIKQNTMVFVGSLANQAMVDEITADGFKVLTPEQVNAQLNANQEAIQAAAAASMSTIQGYPLEIQGARLQEDGSILASVALNLTMLMGIQGMTKNMSGTVNNSMRFARTQVRVHQLIDGAVNASYAPLRQYAADLAAAGAEFSPNGTVKLVGTAGKGLYQVVPTLIAPESYILIQISKIELGSTEVSLDGIQYVINEVALNNIGLTRKTAGVAVIEESRAIKRYGAIPAAVVSPIAPAPRPAVTAPTNSVPAKTVMDFTLA